jgi:hypothetical protein
MSKYRLGDITLKSYNSWENVPREPATIGAAILKVFGVTGTIAGSTALYVGATYLISTAVTYYALQALGPEIPDFSSSTSQGRLVNARQPTAPQQYVYGQVRKGGVIANIRTSGLTTINVNNDVLHMIIVLAGHELEEIGDIYINDEVATLSAALPDGFQAAGDPWDNKIFIKKYKGDQTTPIEGWPSKYFLVQDQFDNDIGTGTGIAFLYVKLFYDQNVFANGVPVFTAKVKGKKVYDPRQGGQSATDSSTWTYSANSALCIADYLRADYGLGDSDYSRIDNTMLQAAANICDEDVTLAAGGTEKRYECHGVLSAENTPANNIAQMITSCAGTLFWGSGQWKLKAGAYTTPVKDFTLDDLRSDIAVKTRSSSRDNFNSVQGTFTDAAQDWISVDYPQIKSTGTFLFEDGGVENVLNLNFPFTTSASMAQRLAKQTLFRGREQITFAAEFGLSAFEIEVGDIVRLTVDRYGWSNKDFEVTSWALNPNSDAGDMRIAMTLQETSQAAFSWAAEEEALLANNTTLPLFNAVPNFGMTIDIETSSFNERLQKDLVVNIASNNLQAIQNIEVQVSRSDFTDLINRERLIQDISGGVSLFVDTVISGRKLGDITNNGSVGVADGVAYEDYYKRTSTSYDTYIEDTLHNYIINNPATFSRYLFGNVSINTDFETLYKGTPENIRFKDFPSGTYSIRARALNSLGFNGAYVTVANVQVPRSDSDIGSPEELNIENVDIQSLKLNWKPVESSALSHYEIRHTKIVDGEEVSAGSFVAGLHYVISTVGTTDFTAIGASANTVGVEFHATGVGSGTGKATNLVKIDKTVPWAESVPRPASSATVGTRRGTYVIRAFSKNGTPSLNYAKATLRSADVSNSFTSSSTKDTWILANNAIALTIPSSSNPFYPAGTYKIADDDNSGTAVFESNGYIDITTSQTARVIFDIDFIRWNWESFKDANQKFDFVFGEFDSLEGNFDDLDKEFRSDVQIIPYVAVTQDAPSGSANWSEWQRITSNVYKARGFKFKFEVNSDTYEVTGAWTDAVATVEY